MLTKLRTFASLYRELGPRWTLFRLAYAFRLRTGFIRLQMPMGEWSDYQKHVGAKSSRPTLPIPTQFPQDVPWNKQTAIGEADLLLNGMTLYFSHQLIGTGFPPNWHKDYFTNHVTLRDSEEPLPPQSEILRSAQNDINNHWSQLSDDSTTDIKFIWELNRFSFVYTFVRAYAATQDEKYPEAFWALIEDWAQHNPPNTGPNWMDGQEIALRLIAWTFGLQQFSNSPSSTHQRISQFTLYVAAQAERIYKNIGYAISTRSNHTISEAFGLWMVGLLFPELKHAEKYLSLGKRLLEQEAASQIFPDGSYFMYSLNYHRFILHIYLYPIWLGELNNSQFSNSLYSSISSSITYLSHLIDPQTGQMPVYGSNDGALVLPLNNCDFTDYRPLLQLGWYITKKDFIFEPGPWDEDIFWLCGEQLTAKSAKPAKKKLNLSALSELGGDSFPDGGMFILHNTNSKAIIRCTDFRARPSHADQLHLDLWMHGHNLAIDAGTYLYSGQGHWRNGLARTSVHNTVTVDGKDQMTMVSRFTWTNWSKGTVLKQEKNLWQGEHDGYKPVSHKRTIMALEGDRWLVIDDLTATESHQYSLHWFLNDVPFTENKNSIYLNYESSIYKVQTGLVNGEGKFTIIRADPYSTRGWRSRYYGDKEPAISLLLEAHQSNARFWTFFGLESDRVELYGHKLQINGIEIDFNKTGY